MSEKLERFLSVWWPVLVVGIGIAVAWGTSSAQLGAISAGVSTLGSKMDNVQTDVAAIKATLPYTKEEIADLRGRISVLEAKR